MTTRQLIMVTSLTLSVLFTGACGRKPQADDAVPKPGDDALTIAVIPKGTTHSFWKTIHAGAEEAAKELGIQIIWQGPQKEDDRQMQIQVVQNLVSRKVDAIVLAPLDDRALVSPVEAAVAEGIPVIIIDSSLQSEAYTSFIATDNFAGGKLCAQHLAETMGGTGTALMLRYSEGHASTGKREEGFLAGMKEYGPGIELVSTNQYGGATMEKAFQAAQNLLNRYGQVDGIFCPNESSTQGMLRALQTSGMAGKVAFVGFDSNTVLIKALRDGHIHGLALQSPFNMGYFGVKAAVDAINGNPVEKRIDTGVVLVTAENVDTPEMQRLLNPLANTPATDE